MVQLFGGENPDALSQENMAFLSQALKKADARKQKILLRIIKRFVSVTNIKITHFELEKWALFPHQGFQITHTVYRRSSASSLNLPHV
jgi:hypothetical protein